MKRQGMNLDEFIYNLLPALKIWVIALETGNKEARTIAISQMNDLIKKLEEVKA